MHKPVALNLLYVYDVKLKYFYIKHDFYINFISHSCIKSSCFIVSCCS